MSRKIAVAANSAGNILTFRQGLIRALRDSGYEPVVIAPRGPADDERVRDLAVECVIPDELKLNIIFTLLGVFERTAAEDEAEVVALLAEPQHMNMAEAELIRALQSDRDGGQEERY